MSASDRELRIKAETLKCRHYTGTHRETCRLGINYRQHVGGPDLGWALKIPCHRIAWTHVPEGVERVPCDLYSPWTLIEATENVDAIDAAVDRHMKAHRAAHDDAKAKGIKRGKGGCGTCKCPCCEVGTIHYSVASYNGHMHAACSTDGCVSWME